MKRTDFVQLLDLLDKKLLALYKAEVIAYDPAVKLTLNEQIKETEQQIARLEARQKKLTEDYHSIIRDLDALLKKL